MIGRVSRLGCAFAVAGAAAMLACGATAQSALPTEAQARDYVRSLLVTSPYRIPRLARLGEIRYRVAFAPGRAWSWPETGEQHVIARGEDIELRICADCGREPAPTAAALRAALAANDWVRSDDRRIRAFARAHARGGSVDTRMTALSEAVARHMTGPIDFRRYDDAVAALETRSGDCTEFAVLLAAAARSLGMPARVAHGIAYAERFDGEAHVFMPHAWTQVWDGQRWRSYDAALGRFDAGHIALFIGDGSPEGLSGLAPVVRSLRVVAAAGVARDTASPAHRPPSP